MASDILVVDDEADIREIVAGILDDEGHETRTAADSDSALAAISDRVPRLIFLDIWLQGSRLDGLQVRGDGGPADWWRAAAVAGWAHLDATGTAPDVTGVHPPTCSDDR